MVTDKLRFNRNHPELHNYGGIIPDLESFDAQFFGVHAKLSLSMDSMSRKLLEQTYQAIFDAGTCLIITASFKLPIRDAALMQMKNGRSYYKSPV